MKQAACKGAYIRIWRTVLRIPRGKVASYGMIARLSGFPRQGRVAGYALHQLPPGIDIPWQRVINAGGKISLPGQRGEKQRRLLKSEGIVIERGRIDMEIFGWPACARHRARRPRGRPAPAARKGSGAAA